MDYEYNELGLRSTTGSPRGPNEIRNKKFLKGACNEITKRKKQFKEVKKKQTENKK